MRVHSSHYSHRDPAEARCVTPAIIRAFCIAGQASEIVERLIDLERQGVSGSNFIAPTHRQYALCDEFAQAVIAPMA